MLFVVLCIDGPNAAKLREELGDEPRQYLIDKQKSIKIAGPFLGDTGQSIGGLAIIHGETEDDVRALIESHPLVSAGAFSRVELYAWKQLIGTAL
jgi:uncharacterized protein YciI